MSHTSRKDAPTAHLPIRYTIRMKVVLLLGMKARIRQQTPMIHREPVRFNNLLKVQIRKLKTFFKSAYIIGYLDLFREKKRIIEAGISPKAANMKLMKMSPDNFVAFSVSVYEPTFVVAQVKMRMTDVST